MSKPTLLVMSRTIAAMVKPPADVYVGPARTRQRRGLSRFEGGAHPARGVALEVGPDGIRVNTIVPGGTDTAAWRRAFATVPAAERHAGESVTSPLSSIGRSDAASFATGGEFDMDGGAWLLR